MRYDNWKIVFLEQRVHGTLQVWAEPFTELRVPKIFNLRTDPYERADITSNTYYDWMLDHACLLVPAQAFVAQMLATFVEFPPRQEPASFSVDRGAGEAEGRVCRAHERPARRVARRRSTGGRSRLDPGGTFRMGSDAHYPEEAPAHRVEVERLLDRPHDR